MRSRFLVALPLFLITIAYAQSDTSPPIFVMKQQWSLDGAGGVPFIHDLDGNGTPEVLLLQSAGMFHSKAFDIAPYNERITQPERDHFCLTALNADGSVRWRIGEPWKGDRPFVSHSAERALDVADIDGDGAIEVVCARGGELIVVDGITGEIERSAETPSDNAQIVCIGKTGPGAADCTILVKNPERPYPPHEYANPCWFYSPALELLAENDYLGAGHAPIARDVDYDGLDEFLIGFNLIDHDLSLVWTFLPVPPEQWDAGEMHVDGMALGEVGGTLCVAYAASDVAYLVDAQTGDLLWKRQSTHPQHVRIGSFSTPGENQVFIHNKRAELQLYSFEGNEIWRMMPPENFPLGKATACERQKFHVFDPTTVLPALGRGETDLLIFTDGGWPYAIDGTGQRCAEFPVPATSKQDWGNVPGRPDDYGYGFYARVADFEGDGRDDVLINDRRYAWLYGAETQGKTLPNGIALPAAWPPDYTPDVTNVLLPPWTVSQPSPIPIDLGRQLFVDDFLVEESTLQRTWHTLDPYEHNPILRPDRPYESEGDWKGQKGEFAIPYSDGVWYDAADGKFKMWYMAGFLYATCYAESTDGLTWEKPELDIVPGTNIVHSGNRDSAVVWLDHADADPAKRYKLFRFQKKPRRGFVLHYSPDGIHWSDEIAWAGPCHDRTTAFYNPFAGVWAISAKAMLPPTEPYESRVRRYHEGATLEEAFRWGGYTDPPFWVGKGRPAPDAPEGFVKSEVYCLDAAPYESLMLGLFTVHEAPSDEAAGRPKRNQVHVGFSRDGFHWMRPDMPPFIGVSETEGDWNWGNVQSVGGCCLVMGDRLYVYYSGRAGGSDPNMPGGFFEGGASTGVGFLRRDGFASLDAGDEGGTLTTRPVIFPGTHLFVNAAAPQGELRVEVLDDSGAVVAPFTAENCVPVQGDSTSQRIQWNGANDLSALAGTPVRFRFHLRTGALYSFWVSQQNNGASGGYVAGGGPGFARGMDAGE